MNASVHGLISIVVPTRKGESVDLTMSTLMRQTYQDFEVHVIVDSMERGAPWARNAGAELARGQYLLFSDNDIDWDPGALDAMVKALTAAREDEIKSGDVFEWRTAYAFGGYYITGVPTDGRTVGPVGNEPWDFATLKGRNFISTMSLMTRQSFMGFDEKLGRLQDWDLWLRLAMQARRRGVWVGRPLFSTPYREGISFDGRVTYEEAWRYVRIKAGLPV